MRKSPQQCGLFSCNIVSCSISCSILNGMKTELVSERRVLDLSVDAAPTRSSDQHKATCDWPLRRALVVTRALERAKGIEPSYAAWEAAVLPLNYARGRLAQLI